MWVRSEYAGELAVVSTWVCALLPWSVSYASQGSVRLIRIHFLYLFFQFVPGIDLGEIGVPYLLVYQAPSFPENTAVAFGYRLWIVAAVVFSVALGVSIVYYAYDEQLELRSPVHPVRALGGLLLAAAVPLTGTTYFLFDGFAGTTIPIGVVFMYLLGSILLVVDLTDVPASG
jgi:uncharacterized protein (TIGR04206 family)